MSELIERAHELEATLNDCGATFVEASLAAVRAVFESDPTEISAGALRGALAMADAVLTQIERYNEPYERDGDIQVGFASFGPGKQTDAFVAKVRAVEIQAVVARRKLLSPLVAAAAAVAANEISSFVVD